VCSFLQPKPVNKHLLRQSKFCLFSIGAFGSNNHKWNVSDHTGYVANVNSVESALDDSHVIAISKMIILAILIYNRITM
jgi:hypothetical protein